MKFASVVFNPLIMPTITFSLIFYYLPEAAAPIPSRAALYLTLAVFITTGIIPLLSLGMMRLSANVSNFWVTQREERVTPFFFITGFYCLTAYMLVVQFEVGRLLDVVVISTAGLVLVLTLITVYWKISIHGAAIMALVGVLMALSFKFKASGLFIPLLVSILIAGWTMSSRLYLNAHTPVQVFAGALLGFLLSFLPVYLLA